MALKPLRSKHNIAVVGLYRSGKTVFMTSMINHVMNHKPGKLAIGGGGGKSSSEVVEIIFDKELPPESGHTRFPYQRYRSEGEGKWPLKTRHNAQFRCTFFRNDWKFTTGELTMVDVPGERLSDLSMVRKSWAEWSDWMFEHVFTDKQCRTLAANYLQSLNEGELTESKVVDAYRELMAKLYLSYRPVITPSTFLLGKAGEFFGRQLVRNDLSKSFSGEGEGEQFAPLPGDLKDKSPELFKLFEERYERYRANVVNPLVNTLSSCNELVILVDVTTILGANTGMYNGCQLLVSGLLDGLSPGSNLAEVVGDQFRKLMLGHLRKIGINRIAVVATKADKVKRSQVGQLKKLVQEMTQKKIGHLKHKVSGLTVEHFSCAALKSTHSQENGLLRGKLTGDDSYSEYETSDLPESWPDRWKEGDYIFPDVDPLFPENDSVPPDHLGMDSVITFLLKPQV